MKSKTVNSENFAIPYILEVCYISIVVEVEVFACTWYFFCMSLCFSRGHPLVKPQESPYMEVFSSFSLDLPTFPSVSQQTQQIPLSNVLAWFAGLLGNDGKVGRFREKLGKTTMWPLCFDGENKNLALIKKKVKINKPGCSCILSVRIIRLDRWCICETWIPTVATKSKYDKICKSYMLTRPTPRGMWCKRSVGEY